MRYKIDVMTGSKREAAGIGDGASKLELTQQKQQNTSCRKSSDMPHVIRVMIKTINSAT